VFELALPFRGPVFAADPADHSAADARARAVAGVDVRRHFDSPVRGYRPRDEDVYVIYSEPGRMLGRFALHDDRTLFLFVFTGERENQSVALDLPAQKAILRERNLLGIQWECPHIFGELDRTQTLYLDRVRQNKSE